MLSHQNKREALVIGDIFYSLGYNVKIALFNAPEECDTRKYDIIFGLEPNFVTMSQRNPQALSAPCAAGRRTGRSHIHRRGSGPARSFCSGQGRPVSPM
jgi:hypothetical protein